jgi:hypothetical protein
MEALVFAVAVEAEPAIKPPVNITHTRTVFAFLEI